MLRKGNGGAAHHEVAVCHMVGQQAGEGLEDLAHGAIADDDEALPREALGEVRGVHPVQVAGVGLEDLPELLHQQVTQVCALRLSTLWRVFMEKGVPMVANSLQQLPARYARASYWLPSKHVSLTHHSKHSPPLRGVVWLTSICSAAAQGAWHRHPSLGACAALCEAGAAACLMSPAGRHGMSMHTETGARWPTFCCSTWYFGSMSSERQS